jgi:hypothetical protein
VRFAILLEWLPIQLSLIFFISETILSYLLIIHRMVKARDRLRAFREFAQGIGIGEPLQGDILSLVEKLDKSERSKGRGWRWADFLAVHNCSG